MNVTALKRKYQSFKISGLAVSNENNRKKGCLKMLCKLKGFMFVSLSVFIAVIVMPSIASSGLIWPLKIGDTYKFFFEEPGEEPGYDIYNKRNSVSGCVIKVYGIKYPTHKYRNVLLN
jgi:hypothetical protein